MSLEFKNEVLTLSKIEHLNLVRFYGYGEHGDERIIVVEYVANGTLREHLDSKRSTTCWLGLLFCSENQLKCHNFGDAGSRGNGLEMAERLDIAIDVAHAITYLHMYTGMHDFQSYTVDNDCIWIKHSN